MKVLIADDQLLLRESIGQILKTDDAFKIIDKVSNGREAVVSAVKHQPDVVLMDIEMPEMNGIEALKQIKLKVPSCKVIMLTTFENTENIMSAFLSDADGYVTKDIDCEELMLVMKCVLKGLTVIHESVKKIMIKQFNRTGHVQPFDAILTEEEIKLVKAIVDGKSNKELGKQFNYTEGTIKNKVSKIYEKLELSDRVQLAVYAVAHGIE